tara:strand:+ start:116 stop:457 length:342 start_codon:yes stop_codon:yes gene_type:complete
MENNKLYTLKCSACSGNTPKLNLDQIVKNLNKINNWEKNNENEIIFKKFKFNSFKKVMEFINIVGKIAEEESHHPDISFGYDYCLILIHTHAIKGLSINDFILASKIDQILFQ